LRQLFLIDGFGSNLFAAILPSVFVNVTLFFYVVCPSTTCGPLLLQDPSIIPNTKLFQLILHIYITSI